MCHEIMFPSNDRSYTHASSSTWQTKHELNKDDTDEHENHTKKTP